MATAGQALDKARSYLGLIEGPKDNQTIFGAWTGANYQPWCHSFVSYVLDQVGAGIGKITYCPAGVAYFRSKGALYTTPQAGDLFFLYFPTMGRYAHVGFVERVDGDHIVTVEGNSNANGSRTGGMVCRNRRLWRGTKTVFGRPAYTAPAAIAPAPPPPQNRTAPDIDPPHYLPPIVGAVKSPCGGVWLGGRDGSLYAYGAPDKDAPNRHPEYWADRTAVDLVPGVDGGYKFISSEGNPYEYPGEGGTSTHIGKFSPPHHINPIVSVLKAPGGGVWLLSRDGAIYAYGAPDKDAPNRHPEYWGGRVAAKLEANGDGYTVVDSTGARYNYP